MTDALLARIGNTPLVELGRLSPRPGVRLFAKLEGLNPSGSVKDRVALALVEEAERAGKLRPGMTIVEASSGNTGIALTMVARRKGYDVRIVLPKEVAPSIGDALGLYGADCIWCPRCVGMDDAIRRAHELSEKHGWYPLGQFEQAANMQAHYRTTGVELLAQLDRIDVFVAGIGTGGTVMGVGKRLRERNPDVQIIGIEPKLGDKLQGLRSLAEGFRPPLLDLDALDGRMARLLKASSDFGAELDSLSDFVSFGVSPAFIMYYWSLQNLGGIGWAVALFYAVCMGLRLAMAMSIWAVSRRGPDRVTGTSNRVKLPD